MEGLGLTEVLDATQHLKLLGVEKCGVVTGVVLLDIVRSEPSVLEALLCRDPRSRVLIEHLTDEVLG